MRRSSRSGFSLVELLLASSLALGVMGLTLGVARRASDSYADSVLMGELEARSARVAREVRDLLADATLADESSVQLMDLRLFEERAWSLVVPRARWVEGQGRVEETLGLAAKNADISSAVGPCLP